MLRSGFLRALRPLHKCARPARRADGVNGGCAAEWNEGTLGRRRVPCSDRKAMAGVARSDPEADAELARRRPLNTMRSETTIPRRKRLHRLGVKPAGTAALWQRLGCVEGRVEASPDRPPRSDGKGRVI